MSKMTTAMGNAHRLTRSAMEEASRTSRTELGVEYLLLALTLDEADAGGRGALRTREAIHMNGIS